MHAQRAGRVLVSSRHVRKPPRGVTYRERKPGEIEVLHFGGLATLSHKATPEAEGTSFPCGMLVTSSASGAPSTSRAAIGQVRFLDILIAAHPPDALLPPTFPGDPELPGFDRLDNVITFGYACLNEAAVDARCAAIRSGYAG